MASLAPEPAATPDAAPIDLIGLLYAGPRRFLTLVADARALLADDVPLDLVLQRKVSGRREVGTDLGNHDWVSDWLLVPAMLGGAGGVGCSSGREGQDTAVLHRSRLARWRSDDIPRLPLPDLHRSGRTA